MPVGEVRHDNRALGELLGIPARETPSRTALLGMIAAAQAVADAAIPAAARVALVSGTSVGGMDLTENFYRAFRSDNGRGRLRSVAGHDCADSTRRIAEYCGITGYTATVSTACSSAANAVITGALLLENDMADYVVAGGTDALCRFTLNGFNSLSILDRERCRPFDATRAGLNLGEGAGYIVLAREAPGMRSYCRLAGYANANDAHHQTASSETGEGAYRADGEALARSGLERVDLHQRTRHGDAEQRPDRRHRPATAVRRAGAAVQFDERLHRARAGRGRRHRSRAVSAGHRTRTALRQSPDCGPIPELGLRPVAETESAAVNSVLSNSFGFGGNCSTLIFAKMKAYVNCITSGAELRSDIKVLIPEN